MITKLHLSGVAVAYELSSVKRLNKLPGEESPLPPGREQGSLYSWQKRSIADACTYLMINARKVRGRCALILTITSPGFTSAADEPRFISKFIENAKKNYGLQEYVWVREYTKAGYPHFHMVGDWFARDHWFSCDVVGCRHDGPRCARPITRISRYWSGLFGSTSPNSVWLGGYWYGKRIYHLNSERQCRYLTKYLGKSIPPAIAQPCRPDGIALRRIFHAPARPVPLPFLNTCAKYPSQ